MRARRAVVIGAAGAIGAVLLSVGLAWACTNFIRIESVTPVPERPLTAATVRGTGAPAAGMVQLRWNAVDGPVLAKVQADAAGAFSTEIKVPHVTPGIYVLIAQAGGYNGRAAMQVGLNDTGASPAYSISGRDVTKAPSAGTPLVVGMGVLAVGLVALASGALVVSARRRRAFAVAGTRRADSDLELTRR